MLVEWIKEGRKEQSKNQPDVNFNNLLENVLRCFQIHYHQLSGVS